MKIAIFRTDHNPLNLEQYNCQELGLAKALINSGHEVTIVLVRNEMAGSKYPEMINHQGKDIRLVQLDFKIIPTLEYPLLIGIDKTLKIINPDVCHINEESCPATLQVAWYAKKLNVSIVCYHGMYSTPGGSARSLYEYFHNYLVRPFLRRNIQHLFAKTTFAEKFLKERGYSNVTVLPVGLDTVNLEKSVEKKIERSLPAGKSIVLYVGVFEKRRNIQFLLELAERAQGENLHFVYVGRGPEEQYAKDFIKNKQIYNVTLPGALQQSELAFYYENASVFLLASNYEIFGMVLLEAMYFGLPIVSNLNAGSLDLVSKSNGTILQELTPELWIKSINYWVSTCDPLTKINISNKFMSNFTWEKISNIYLEEIRRFSFDASSKDNLTK